VMLDRWKKWDEERIIGDGVICGRVARKAGMCLVAARGQL
jgi:hypothetical protein